MRRLIVFFAFIGILAAEKPGLEYIPDRQDEIFRRIDSIRETEEANLDSVTEVIQKKQDAKAKEEKERRKLLRWNMEDIKRPGDPESFSQIFHFSPNHQDATGTCWSFAATSFIESEITRMGGKKIKLSEMHTVYYEYLEKIRRYIERRGDSFIGQGSQIGNALQIMDRYGIVPESVYPGKKGEFHDHKKLFKELTAYLDYVEDQSNWDPDRVTKGVRVILNHYLGEPPEVFEFAGEDWTPCRFSQEFLNFRAEDYVDLISTMKEPFYIYTIFDVPDNWRRDSSYYNIPLDQWMKVIKSAVEEGYSVAIGGDVSEPSFYKEKDMAVTAPVDIPAKHIDQEAREYRIYNGSTTDDHGIHIVGYTRYKGWNWYLVKDSGSTGRAGDFFGYMFYRDDFIKLKMLGITLHRDAVEKVIGEF
jgi:bleomycin hydrolase